MTKPLNIAHFKRLLLTREAELKKLVTASTEACAPVELDQQSVGRLSRMDALQGQAMALETERRRAAELNRIYAALKRIEKDDYGYCLSCEEAINLKRLELDPSIAVCVDCASIS